MAPAGFEKKWRLIKEKEKKILLIKNEDRDNNECEKISKVRVIQSGLVKNEKNKFLTQNTTFSRSECLYRRTAAEEVFISGISTIVSNDLEQTTDIIKVMVSMYCMR